MHAHKDKTLKVQVDPIKFWDIPTKHDVFYVFVQSFFSKATVQVFEMVSG